jgi:hypothetical protein
MPRIGAVSPVYRASRGGCRVARWQKLLPSARPTAAGGHRRGAARQLRPSGSTLELGSGTLNYQLKARRSKRRLVGRSPWLVLSGIGLCAATACSSSASDPRDQSGLPHPTVAANGDGAPGNGGAAGNDGAAGTSSAEASATEPEGVAGGPSSGAGGYGGAIANPTPDENPSNVSGEGGEGGSSEEDISLVDAEPFSQLRLLTQSEYRRSIVSLLGEGTDAESLLLPEDRVDGFATVGGRLTVVGEAHAATYEAASQTAAAALFNDTERWQALVGCQPQADLSDTCVETYVQTFGRRAFRRDLDDAETTRWVELARSAAALTGDPEAAAATGLAAATAGMLQSPKFLYRVEHAVPDTELNRFRFDGKSMATRLAYLTTGSTPDDALLDAASAGELDTEEGLRAAVERLTSLAEAQDFPTEFFMELTQLEKVLYVEKSVEELSDALRASMFEETHRWLGEIVLAPQADVRSFFDSNTTFVDGPLAEFYGLPAPADGFQRVDLDPSTGRAGIFGKAGVLLVHSSSASTNPPRRGAFILASLMCQTVSPPDDMVATPPQPAEGEAPMTTRQLFETAHLSNAGCVACHAAIDPLGFSLEHFDAIGRFRETENGLPIDASGEFAGEPFEDAIGLAEILRNRTDTSACLVKNFYRYANGFADVQADEQLVAELTTALAERDHVWRELIVDFATSTAFTSMSPLQGVAEVADLDAVDAAESPESAEE